MNETGMLSGKVAVITGGGGVLCAEMARTIARNGGLVAILDLSVEAAHRVKNEVEDLGGKGLALACDVLDPASLSSARDQVMDHFGRCDILVNGAGGNHPKGTTSREVFERDQLSDPSLRSFFDLDPSGVEFVFNLNFMGTLLPSQVFGEVMIDVEGATIINISSMNAFTPLTKIPAYSAAKAAVSNFTQWLAVHFANSGIRVNALAPGFFLTEQNRKLLTEEDGTLTERGNKIIAQTPMARFGNPSDLSSTLLWLCDPGSGFVTGVVVPVDGGFSAYSGV